MDRKRGHLSVNPQEAVDKLVWIKVVESEMQELEKPA